jgi:hypothetical protein
MKSSIKAIYETYPEVEKKMQDKNIQLKTNQDEIFFQLALFINEPEKYSFNLSLLYQFLEDDELIFALETVFKFFKNDTYLIKNQKHLLIKDLKNELDLFNQQMFSDYLNENGFNFSPPKVNTYLRRGTNNFPEADIKIGGKPYWLKETVERYTRTLKK